MSETLFSYGTLQMARVQRALFGRAIAMTPDTLTGYREVELALRDPEAVATSGVVLYKALEPDAAAPPLRGALLQLTAAELARADAYEVADYARVAATFGSGRTGWVYIRA